MKITLLLFALVCFMHAGEEIGSTNTLKAGTNADEIVTKLRTNVITEWITVEDNRPKQEPVTPESLANPRATPHFRQAVIRYDAVKQVGFLMTNRVLLVVHLGITNEVILSTLYRDEWPTQKRTLSIPRY